MVFVCVCVDVGENNLIEGNSSGSQGPLLLPMPSLFVGLRRALLARLPACLAPVWLAVGGPRLGKNLWGVWWLRNLRPCTTVRSLLLLPNARPFTRGEGVLRSSSLGHSLSGAPGRLVLHCLAPLRPSSRRSAGAGFLCACAPLVHV